MVLSVFLTLKWDCVKKTSQTKNYILLPGK
jgi:hypothetical protein